ncbi:HPr family phosphocarrier protein [Mesomycoplasma neurolyticum]|uniref:Phosphocarrier protein HPr n=1 Tax=Mesomycoplasma neurolyticum TaxID=2120 RepID=A0A449A4I6_9BACT|nr:HPr family phosphocarrier protein [Mesomycoplasma neurolyticum]VEU59146.1 Phosphocarrier protein HPr [Mesomycoplasma neurolyticum]
MVSFTAKIVDPLGLHARPASKIAQIAAKFPAEIKIITSDNRIANAKSIMNIMSLGIKAGSTLIVEVSGENESAVLETIKKTMIENNLI